MSEQGEGKEEVKPAYDDVLVQYIVVRKDLMKKPFKWSYGSLIGNACHASVNAITTNLDDPHTKAYVAPDAALQMHKVVLAAQSEDELMATAAGLDEAELVHSLWIEHPEKLPTCLATRPYPRGILQPLFKGLKLFR